jgi:hypothetical protein
MIDTQVTDVDQIVAAITAPQGGSEQAPEAPQVFGEVPADKFHAALKAAAGIDSLDDVRAGIEARSKLADYQTKLQEYEAKQAVSPFANPLIEKLNTVARNGADLNQIERLIQLNKVDVANVVDVDAIKLAKGLEKPNYTAEELDVLIERELGFSPEDYDETNPAHRVAMRELADKARQAIQNERVSLENPEAIAKAAEAQRQQAVIVDGWATKVLPAMANDISIPFSMQDENQGIDYNFDFKPSKDQVNQAMQAAVATIQANPSAFPLQMEKVEDVRHLIKSFLLMFHGEDIMKSMARDAYAKATLALQQKVAGPPPNRPVANIPPMQTQRKGAGNIPADALY